MALGTDTIDPVDMLVGPAMPSWPKPSASSSGASASTCSPGRPRRWSSRDDSVDGELCATDLLGQAEHGPDSPAILLTTSRKLATDTIAEVERLLQILPTAGIARRAWEGSRPSHRPARTT